MSYVELMDKPILTVHPTTPYYQDDAQCDKAKKDCTEMFVNQCDNAYRIADSSWMGSHVSGISACRACCQESGASRKNAASAVSGARMASSARDSRNTACPGYGPAQLSLSSQDALGQDTIMPAGLVPNVQVIRAFPSLGQTIASKQYFEYVPSYVQRFEQQAFQGLHQ
jgi:hypothetical protein